MAQITCDVLTVAVIAIGTLAAADHPTIAVTDAVVLLGPLALAILLRKRRLS